jgi:hypothetical protein
LIGFIIKERMHIMAETPFGTFLNFNQKRLRSDLIGAINDKLKIIAESKSNLIDKQRSEFDKRSFEYFIRTEHMKLVQKVLGKKG